MRRVAWFTTVIDVEDEAVAQTWLTTVNEALNRFAEDAAKICGDKLTLVKPMESGQSIPIVDEPPKERDDV